MARQGERTRLRGATRTLTTTATINRFSAEVHPRPKNSLEFQHERAGRGRTPSIRVSGWSCCFVILQRCSNRGVVAENSVNSMVPFQLWAAPRKVVLEFRALGGCMGCDACPNMMPVSTSTGRPLRRYGLNLHRLRASPIACRWSGNALRK